MQRVTGKGNNRIRVTPREATVILAPYIGSKFWEQFTLVLPVVAYLVLFQLVVLRESVEQALHIGWGVFCVIIGLMFFMEGLRLGLMPFSERIGAGLPQSATLPVVLGFAFLVGIGATLAEPSIGALKAAGTWIDPEKAPLLYYILNYRSALLVVCIGIGVGMAAALGILRIIRDWRLGVLITPAVLGVLALTFFAALGKETAAVIGLAHGGAGMDTGADAGGADFDHGGDLDHAGGFDHGAGFDHGGVDHGGDVGHGADVHAHAEGAETVAAFKLLSLRSLIAFGMLFGWAGALYQMEGRGLTFAIGLAVVWAFLGMLVVSLLFYGVMRLTETGTRRLATAVGQAGTVYIDIPADGTGQVRTVVSGMVSFVKARTLDGKPLAAGTPVRITGLVDSNTVEVMNAEELEV